MNLGDLIEVLEAMPPETVLPVGFRDPHSWRGDYMDVAFEPYPDVAVADMLAAARGAVGTTYQGYKGGDFTMGTYTPVHLSFEGSSNDYWAVVALSPELAKSRMKADDAWSYARNFEPPKDSR